MSLDFTHNYDADAHFMRLYDKYKLLALNIFKWDNLPPMLESRHIERALYDNGQAVFMKDPDLGLICLPSSEGGRPNIYGESKIAIVTSYGQGYCKNVVVDNNLKTMFTDTDFLETLLTGVRIKNNDTNTPMKQYVSDYARKMYEVELAINLNVEQQKFPYFITTDSKTELTMKTVINKVRKGEPAIFAHKQVDMEKLKVFDLNVPYVVDKLQDYKFELEREILTFFGLNNNYEKKERLLVDEVNSNNDYISRNVELMYKCRKEACDFINKTYNLNITVEKVDLFHTDNETIRENEISMTNNLKLPQGGKQLNVNV